MSGLVGSGQEKRDAEETFKVYSRYSKYAAKWWSSAR
jgi:hypothetical protein